MMVFLLWLLAAAVSWVDAGVFVSAVWPNVVECVVEEVDMVVGDDAVLVSFAGKHGLNRRDPSRVIQPGRVLNPDGGFLNFGVLADQVLRRGFSFESARFLTYRARYRLPELRSAPFCLPVSPLRFPGARRKGR